MPSVEPEKVSGTLESQFQTPFPAKRWEETGAVPLHLGGQTPFPDLFYEEKGQGEPLVLLNGLSGDHLYWTGQLRAFGKGFRCLAVDNRDVGQSSYATAPYSIK